ncbi:MAG: hypothetical protein PVF26_09120 [Desulfobacterales bacterium]|jgi:hypothetical protein
MIIKKISKIPDAFAIMNFLVTNRPMASQAITAHQKSEANVVPFAAALLHICLPNTSEKEVDKIVKDNFRGEKDRVLKKDSKYYILMKGTTIEVAERAVNRLKAKLGLIGRNFRCLKSTKRIQASAFILGTSGITKRFEFKYVDLAPHLNFVAKRTQSMPSGFEEYLKCSEKPTADNHRESSFISILA